jgi:carboxyl-terminal processing protease
MNKRILLVPIFLTILSLACSAGGLLTQIQPTATLTLPPTTTPTATNSPTTVSTETATPLPLPTATPTLFPTATGPRPSPSPQQYQVFDQLWQTVNQNYLYLDFNGLDWNAVREEILQRIGAGLTDDEFYQAMGELVRRLNDNHSTFFSPEQVKQVDSEFEGQYQYVGIGVYHTPMPERNLFSIVLVFPGSPAEEAGLKAHDNILAVDGQPLFDEQGNRKNLLRGPEGTTITLTVQTPGQEVRQVQITRREVLTEMPVPHQVVSTPAGKRIGYLMIPTFNETDIDKRVAQAIQEMATSAPLDGLIIDNRHNGGGRDTIMLNTLGYFVSGEAGYFVNRGQSQPITVQGSDVSGSLGLPLVVLVGDGTASFGEVFSGILKDLGRATIVGTQTDGNVELLGVYDFIDGSRAWIATATFRPLNNPDQDWEKTGITPDIIVSSQWDEVTFENDPVIQEALRFLGG